MHSLVMQRISRVLLAILVIGSFAYMHGNGGCSRMPLSIDKNVGAQCTEATLAAPLIPVQSILLAALPIPTKDAFVLVALFFLAATYAIARVTLNATSIGQRKFTVALPRSWNRFFSGYPPHLYASAHP